MNDLGAFLLSCGLICLVPLSIAWGLVYIGIRIGRGQLRSPLSVKLQNPLRRGEDDPVGYGAAHHRPTGR